MLHIYHLFLYNKNQKRITKNIVARNKCILLLNTFGKLTWANTSKNKWEGVLPTKNVRVVEGKFLDRLLDKHNFRSNCACPFFSLTGTEELTGKVGITQLLWW